jgi:hypothetical protein
VPEALREKKLRPEDFSFRDLAEALVPDGHQWVRQLDPRNSSSGVNLLEAGDGVDVTAFLNITGQVIYSKIMEGYQQEEFINWQPQSWSDVPPRARPIEAAVDGCFNAAQAAAFMEGFNTQVLRDAKPYWAVATNVTAQYQGDLEPTGWISASRLLHCGEV